MGVGLYAACFGRIVWIFVWNELYKVCFVYDVALRIRLKSSRMQRIKDFVVYVLYNKMCLWNTNIPLLPTQS